MSPRTGEEQVLALALEGRVHAASGQTAELVAIAGNLALLPDPVIDQTWAAALEARLLGVEVAPVGLHLVEPAPAPEALPTNVIQMPNRRFVVRRVFAATVAAAMLGAFPIIAVAGSLPGTPGYGVKRSVERLNLVLFGDAVADGFSHAQLAQRRVGEAAQLIALQMDPGLISRTLRDATDALNLSARLVLDNTDDPATLQRLSDVTRETQRQIAALAGDAPSESQVALQGALNASIELQADVARILAPTVPAAPVASIAPTTTTAPNQTTTTSGPKESPRKPPTGKVPPLTEDDPTVPEVVRSCPVLGGEHAGDTLSLLRNHACALRDATY